MVAATLTRDPLAHLSEYQEVPAAEARGQCWMDREGRVFSTQGHGHYYAGQACLRSAGLEDEPYEGMFRHGAVRLSISTKESWLRGVSRTVAVESDTRITQAQFQAIKSLAETAKDFYWDRRGYAPGRDRVQGRDYGKDLASWLGAIEIHKESVAA